MYKLNELALVVLCRLACVAGGSSVQALRQRSCEEARRMGKRQFSHTFGARRSRTINTTSYTGYVGDESETKKIVLLTCQGIVSIEVKFDKLSFSTFLYKTCF